VRVLQELRKQIKEARNLSCVGLDPSEGTARFYRWTAATGRSGCVGLDPSEGTASIPDESTAQRHSTVALGSTRVRVLQDEKGEGCYDGARALRWARPE